MTFYKFHAAGEHLGLRTATKCLGGKIVAMIAYGDTPAKEHMPADTGARIMHARIVLGD
jgi:PhnB protein